MTLMTSCNGDVYIYASDQIVTRKSAYISIFLICIVFIFIAKRLPHSVPVLQTGPIPQTGPTLVHFVGLAQFVGLKC